MEGAGGAMFEVIRIHDDDDEDDALRIRECTHNNVVVPNENINEINFGGNARRGGKNNYLQKLDGREASTSMDVGSVVPVPLVMNDSGRDQHTKFDRSPSPSAPLSDSTLTNTPSTHSRFPTSPLPSSTPPPHQLALTACHRSPSPPHQHTIRSSTGSPHRSPHDDERSSLTGSQQVEAPEDEETEVHVTLSLTLHEIIGLLERCASDPHTRNEVWRVTRKCSSLCVTDRHSNENSSLIESIVTTQGDDVESGNAEDDTTHGGSKKEERDRDNERDSLHSFDDENKPISITTSPTSPTSLTSATSPTSPPSPTSPTSPPSSTSSPTQSPTTSSHSPQPYSPTSPNYIRPIRVRRGTRHNDKTTDTRAPRSTALHSATSPTSLTSTTSLPSAASLQSSTSPLSKPTAPTNDSSPSSSPPRTISNPHFAFSLASPSHTPLDDDGPDTPHDREGAGRGGEEDECYSPRQQMLASHPSVLVTPINHTGDDVTRLSQSPTGALTPTHASTLLTPTHASTLLTPTHTSTLLTPTHTSTLLTPTHASTLLTSIHTSALLTPTRTSTPTHTTTLLTPTHTPTTSIITTASNSALTLTPTRSDDSCAMNETEGDDNRVGCEEEGEVKRPLTPFPHIVTCAYRPPQHSRLLSSSQTTHSSSVSLPHHFTTPSYTSSSSSSTTSSSSWSATLNDMFASHPPHSNTSTPHTLHTDPPHTHNAHTPYTTRPLVASAVGETYTKGETHQHVNDVIQPRHLSHQPHPPLQQHQQHQQPPPLQQHQQHQNEYHCPPSVNEATSHSPATSSSSKHTRSSVKGRDGDAEEIFLTPLGLSFFASFTSLLSLELRHVHLHRSVGYRLFSACRHTLTHLKIIESTVYLPSLVVMERVEKIEACCLFTALGWKLRCDTCSELNLYQLATKLDTEVLFQADGDGQHLYLPRNIAKLQIGVCDMVCLNEICGLFTHSSLKVVSIISFYPSSWAPHHGEECETLQCDTHSNNGSARGRFDGTGTPCSSNEFQPLSPSRRKARNNIRRTIVELNQRFPNLYLAAFGNPGGMLTNNTDTCWRLHGFSLHNIRDLTSQHTLTATSNAQTVLTPIIHTSPKEVANSMPDNRGRFTKVERGGMSQNTESTTTPLCSALHSPSLTASCQASVATLCGKAGIDTRAVNDRAREDGCMMSGMMRCHAKETDGTRESEVVHAHTRCTSHSVVLGVDLSHTAVNCLIPVAVSHKTVSQPRNKENWWSDELPEIDYKAMSETAVTHGFFLPSHQRVYVRSSLCSATSPMDRDADGGGLKRLVGEGGGEGNCLSSLDEDGSVRGTVTRGRERGGGRATVGGISTRRSSITVLEAQRESEEMKADESMNSNTPPTGLLSSAISPSSLPMNTSSRPNFDSRIVACDTEPPGGSIHGPRPQPPRHTSFLRVRSARRHTIAPPS